MTQKILDQDKIAAREMLFLATKQDPGHCKLAVDNYLKEISFDLKSAAYGHLYERRWNPTTYLFELVDNQSPVDMVGWDDGTKIAKLKDTARANAIYRLTKAIFKINYASREVDLVYRFFLTKDNDKLFNKISNNKMKSKQEKSEAIINRNKIKIQHMLDDLETISTQHQIQEIMANTDNHIQENWIKIQDLLSPILQEILENLNIEGNNTPQRRIQARSSIARIICNVIYDHNSPNSFTITRDSYSEEEYQRMETAYIEATRLFDDLSMHKRNFYDEMAKCSAIVADKMLSTMVLLTNLFINQNNMHQNLCPTLPSNIDAPPPPITVVITLANGTEQEFIIPIANLKKLTIYDRIDSYQERQQNRIDIRASDIGPLVNTDMVSLLNFIATQDTAKLQIMNVSQLQEILDYFMVSDQDQEEIIIHTIKNNTSQQLLRESFPLLFSYRERWGYSDLCTEPTIFTEPINFAKKLFSMAKNNRPN